MTVHQVRYEPFRGMRLGPFRRMLAITRVGIRLGLRRRFLVIAMILVVPLTFMFGMLFYLASSGVGEFLGRTSLLFFTSEQWREFLGDHVNIYNLWAVLLNRHMHFQMLWALVIIPWVGPSLLADDFQSRALAIYFSKPITRFEYLFGKWLVLAFFVACVTAVPSTVLYAASILFCRDLDILRHTAYLVPAAWLHVLVVSVVGGLMMMAFSASGRSRRFAALGWLMTILCSWGLASVVEWAPHEMKPVWATVISLTQDVDMVGRAFFRVKQDVDASAFWALGVLAGVGVVSALYLWRRVHTVEVLR